MPPNIQIFYNFWKSTKENRKSAKSETFDNVQGKIEKLS